MNISFNDMLDQIDKLQRENEELKKKKYCKVTKDESLWEDDYYETACGDAFCFFEGDPEDNHYKYCPYCGGELQLDNHS